MHAQAPARRLLFIAIATANIRGRSALRKPDNLRTRGFTNMAQIVALVSVGLLLELFLAVDFVVARRRSS
jgi:hypothetical protein